MYRDHPFRTDLLHIVTNQHQRKQHVACPSCGKQIPWDSSSRCRPFCSERCKVIDLGRWADECYCVTGDLVSGEADKLPMEQG
jgi:endogenous inhibitor of DNA gyrase (YacG/DUF329 family)